MGYRFKSNNNKFITAITITVVVFLIIFVGYTIFTQVQEHHKQNDPKLHELKALLSPLHPNVAKLDFYEGEKSYTINKQKVYLCLRDENGNYYNNEVLKYVFIHELSHSLCKSIGHTEEFHEIFEDLLKKATDMGLYNPSIPIPENYCTYS